MVKSMSKMDVAIATSFLPFVHAFDARRYFVTKLKASVRNAPGNFYAPANFVQYFRADLALLLPYNFHFLVTFSREIYLNAHRHPDLFFLITIPNGTSTSLQNMIYANTSPCYMDSSKFRVVILSDNYVPIRTGQIAKRHMRTYNDFGELCVQNMSQRNYCN